MNALQRLEEAVIALIVGDGELQDRLHSAFEEQLRHIRHGELPAELSGQLQSIMQRYASLSGNHQATKGKGPSQSQASKLAIDIFQLSCAVSQGLYH